MMMHQLSLLLQVIPPPTAGYRAAANNEDHDAIFAWAMQSIAACTTIHEFIHVYEWTVYQTSTERLRSAQGTDKKVRPEASGFALAPSTRHGSIALVRLDDGASDEFNGSPNAILMLQVGASVYTDGAAAVGTVTISPNDSSGGRTMGRLVGTWVVGALELFNER